MAVKNAKKILSLKHRKGRDAEGKFLIEGIRLVEEALGSNAPIDQLVFDRMAVAGDSRLKEMLDEAARLQILIQQTDRRALKHMGEYENPEGVLGVVRMAEWDRSVVLQGEAPLLLVDQLRDPNNLGLMQRTAEAAGAGAVFLSGGSVELYNPKVVRASRGSIFRMPTFRGEDLGTLINELKDSRFQVLCADLEGTPYREVVAEGRQAFLMGNETFGVNPEIRALAQQSITIPITEGVNSLNVAVAAGVLLFHFR
jgi:TrmH family RNA methyltransferase